MDDQTSKVSQIRQQEVSNDPGDVEQLSRAVNGQTPADPGTQIVRFRPGDLVGPYRLVFRIGQGGMGDVYTADRADNLYRRRVALKLMRVRLDGRDMTQRFDSERRILATLNHPNIAKLIDGGFTEHGIPYVVMEFVDGLPLDRYCKEKKLDLRERVRLFLEVCGAVQYAHRNLIVHRDIKPDNILVNEDGQPVLLDFGIAKLLRPDLLGMNVAETRAGAHMMTPEFASPEQFRGERIGTGSDVYSLGVMLYLLLAGKLPHAPEGLTPTELGRKVCDESPAPPSIAGGTEAHIPADLDAIILKALRKEPDSRYLSVEEMANDLWRFLRGFPVRAREGSWRYNASKFLKRHRTATMFAGLLTLILTLAAAALISSNNQVRRERDLAEGTMQFLWELLDGSDPNGARGDQAIAARALLDHAATRLIEAKIRVAPEIRLALADKIGDVYHQLGADDKAEPLIRLSLRLSEEQHGKKSNEAAKELVRMADLLRDHGRFDEAEQAAQRSLQIRRQLFGKREFAVADSLNMTGILHQIRGRIDEAERDFRESVAIRRATIPATDPKLALALGNLGNVLRAKGDLEEAQKCYEEALEIRRKEWGPEHPKVASSLNQLSQVAASRKDFGRSLQLAEESVRIARKAYPDGFNPALGPILVNYGNALADSKRPQEAEVVLKQAIEVHRKAHGPESPEVSFGEAALASVYQEMQRDADAEVLRRHVLAIRLKALGPAHSMTLAAKVQLGNLLLKTNRKPEAKTLFEDVVAARKDKPQDPNAVKARKGLEQAAS